MGRSENMIDPHYRQPWSTIIKFVPQQEAWVVERFGRYSRTLEPGLNMLIPCIDTVQYVHVLKEVAVDIPSQTAITKDNVAIALDGVLYLRVHDAYKASYGVANPQFAITQLAQTSMRSEIGQITLDGVFRERDSLNQKIVEAVNAASTVWGIACLRYEIRDVAPPQRVQLAMQMEVEAERKRRAAILESEGERDSKINRSEGEKKSRILRSEGDKIEQINKAEGEAEALQAVANARAQAIRSLGEQLTSPEGAAAASFEVAEKYVHAFQEMAKQSTTVVLPANIGDVGGFVAQSLAIYKGIAQQPGPLSRT